MSPNKWQSGLLIAACSLAITGCQFGSNRVIDQPAKAPAVNESLSANTISQSRRPNVVILFADDLGYADAGFQNRSKDVSTPNMDSLAQSGAVFNAGYVTGTVCGPSRAGLMTGRYQQRFGYHDNTAPFSRDADTPVGLDLSVPVFASYLHNEGYRTGMVGKWHDAGAEEYWPHNRGFDEFFGFNNGAATYYVGPMNAAKHEYKKEAAVYRNGVLEDDFDQYLTDKFGDEAVEYIERNKDEAFMLYVAFNAIHSPMEPRQIDMDRFAHIENEDRRKAVAMNYNMDENIGKILDKLEQENLMEDTIIFFLSDNGGKLNDNYSLNTPLRGEKGTFWEGGIRIPFTATWQGTIPAGQSIDDPIIALDILPTSLAAAGIDINPDWQLEGENLLPLLTGEREQLDDRFLFWANSRGWAVRDRDWKLYDENQRRRNQKPVLFNLTEDMAEQNELSATNPEQVARLKAAYKAWDADNESPRWGWSQKVFPYYNGHHETLERREKSQEDKDFADNANEERRAKARSVIDAVAR